MVAAVLAHPEEAADAFGDALIRAWEVDTASDYGRGFVAVECELFQQALEAMPARPGVAVARAAKMHRELMAYRAAVGSCDADQAYDFAVHWLAAFVRDAAVG